MRADELLEGGDLVHLRVVGAIDHDVSNVLEAIRAPDVPADVEIADDRRHLEFALNHRSPRAHERVG